MTERDYYEQPELWNRAPEPYQIQVLADVLDLIPEDVESILDVGCGDGFVTNALPDRLHVVGVDSSAEALSRVKRETRRGLATELPCEDHEFDLVMANDLLEHLDRRDLVRTIAELGRVARRYVLLTVPLLEDLRSQRTRCLRCGMRFHVNLHKTWWNEDRIRALGPPGFRSVQARYSGALLSCPPDPCAILRQQAAASRKWAAARCPRCGAPPPAPSSEGEGIDALLDAVAARTWWGEGQAFGRIDRSEIVVLFARPPFEHTVRPSGKPQHERDLLELDFTNPLQRVVEWTPGASWARYRLREGVRLEQVGAVAAPLAGGPCWLEVRLPAVAAAGDRIEVECSGPGHARIYAWDSILRLETLLGSASADHDEITVAHGWPSMRTGLALNVYIDPGMCLRRLRYRPVSGSRPVSFVRLEKGHNVCFVEAEGRVRSWGVRVSEPGWWPAPIWLDAEDVAHRTPAIAQAAWRHVLEEAVRVHERAVTKIGELAAALEARRQAADRERETPRPMARRVERVLLLADPDDAESGARHACARARALREHQGIDARVLLLAADTAGLSSWEPSGGVPVASLGTGAHDPRRIARGLRRMADTLWRSFRFDLVDASLAPHAGPAARLLGRRFAAPALFEDPLGGALPDGGSKELARALEKVYQLAIP